MRTILIFLAIFLLYVLRLLSLSRLDLKDGQLVKVTGILREEPQISGNRQQFKIGQFTVWTKRFPEYHYGEEIEAVGRIKSTSFNYPLIPISFKSYLLSYPEITPLRPPDGETSEEQASITGVMIGLKKELLTVFKKSFPQPLDGIMAGIVLGNKTLLPPDFQEKLKLTGTIHIMVASGMNVVFLANGVLTFLAFFLKRRTAIFIAISLIYLYGIMTGLQAPIIRASIMVSLIYLGSLSGRESRSDLILLFAATIMLFYDPKLIFDLGFQLSFLSTAGLIFIQPRLQTAGLPLLRTPNFSSTLAAQIATLPVLAGSFGRYNLVSPLINLAILWTIPYLMGIGVIVGFAGLLWIRLATLASYLAFPLLFYVEQVINLSAKLTVFQLELPKIGFVFTVLYYLILGRWVYKNRT